MHGSPARGIHRSPFLRPLFLMSLLCILTAMLAIPLAAGAVAPPDTVLSTDPASPDGAEGWYLSKPQVFASPDQSGTVYYRWSDHRGGSVVASAGATVSVGAVALEGSSSVSVYTISSEGVTEAVPARLTLRVDTLPPSAPSALEAWKNAEGWVRLWFTGSTDAASGVAAYDVFRSIAGGDYELVATLPASTTRYDDRDEGLTAEDDIAYKVVARDRVGHESATSAPASAVLDVTPPTTPMYVEAWPSYSGAYGGMSFDGRYWRADLEKAMFDIYSYGSHDGTSGIAFYECEYGPDKYAPVYSSQSTVQWSWMVSGPRGVYVDWFFRVRTQDRAGNTSAWSRSAEAKFTPVGRIAGADRIATALQVSKQSFDTSKYAVFVGYRATVDGLLASSLAGYLDAPIIPVTPGPLPQATLDELTRLGVTDAFVVGGSGTVDTQTYAGIDAAVSGGLERIAGPNRYSTGLLVADRLRLLSGKSPERVFVVSGADLTGAMTAAPAAYASGQPIILAGPGHLSEGTYARFQRWDVRSQIVVGPRSLVWGAPRSYYGSGPEYRRIGTTDPVATAQAFRDWAVADGVLPDTQPVVLSVAGGADAPAAAVLAGARSSAVWLIPSRANYTFMYSPAFANMDRLAKIRKVTIVGGERSVPEFVMYMFWSRLSYR